MAGKRDRKASGNTIDAVHVHWIRCSVVQLTVQLLVLLTASGHQKGSARLATPQRVTTFEPPVGRAGIHDHIGVGSLHR